MSEDQTNTTAFEDRRFRLLIDAVVDYAIYMIDPDGIIISWNAGARRFKGYEEVEIIGQHFSRFYTDDDRGVGKPQKALDTAIREGRFEGEGWRVRKDGTHFWSHVVIDPIYDPSGQLLGFAKITRDLTDRKMAQQALEKTREALFQAQKMQAIGQLSGGIAHDFNNLLTVILGNLEIVRKRISDDPKITRLLDNATQGALRGVSLTQRMLAFARRQELKSEPVEIPALVQGISGLLRSSLGPSVVLETRFPAELEPVLADVNQLELAVLNLATNARDAMPHGGKIVISTRTEDVCDDIRPPMAAGRYVCLSPTRERAWMTRRWHRQWTRFSRQRGWVKGPGWGYRWSTVLSSNWEGGSSSKARRTTEQPQSYGCPSRAVTRPLTLLSMSRLRRRCLG